MLIYAFMIFYVPFPSFCQGWMSWTTKCLPHAVTSTSSWKMEGRMPQRIKTIRSLQLSIRIWSMTMMRTGGIVGVAGQVRQVGPFLAGSWFVKPSNSMYIYTYVYCQHQVIWLGSVWLKMNKCPAAEPSLLWWAMTLSDFSSAQGITHGPVTNQGSAFNCPRVNQAWQ